MILREIKTKERFIEIVRSIPNPILSEYITSKNGQQIMVTEAVNEGGICQYRYIENYNLNDVSPSLLLRIKNETI